MISAGEVHMPGRPRDVVGLKAMAIFAQRAFWTLPARRREGACRRAGDRMRNGRGGLQGAGRGRRQAARRSRARRRQGRPDREEDGGLGAQIRHPEHHPHRRPVDPRLRPDRRGRGARGRHRRDRPHQWRPHRAARRRRSAASARAASAASNWCTTATSARRSTRCGSRARWASSTASSSAPTRRPAPACSRSASCAWCRCCRRSATCRPNWRSASPPATPRGCASSTAA